MARDGDLRILFRKHLPKVFWTSVETGATGRGTPDSFGCYEGSMFWIEFKEAKHWKVIIRPEQIAWHLRLARNGGNSWIAIRRTSKELWLIRGADVDRASLLAKPGRYYWDGGPRAWDWDAILQLIISPPK